jgi:hypothetical protein
MEIIQITKKEQDKIRHDQKWGLHECMLFEFDGKRYKCTKTGAAGVKAIYRFKKARKELKRNQLNLLGM